MIEGPAGKWPDQFSDDQLNKDQLAVVQRNANLLQNRSDWEKKVNTFENRLKAQYLDEDVRDEIRKKYTIRFDGFRFKPRDNGHDFTRFLFPCSVSFDGTTFGDGDVRFIGATFGDGDVRFRGATFGDGNVQFSGTAFGDGSVWFDRTTFGDGDVSFFGATFGKGIVWFSWTMFGNGHVWFDEATFGDGDVSFLGATFGDGDVTFSGATFGDGHVRFDGTTFGDGDVSFFVATFGDGDVVFAPRILNSTSVSFQGSGIKGNLFLSSLFPKDANFKGLEVKGTSQFSDCVFVEIPDFRDAKFDRPPEVARMVIPAPKLDVRRGLFRVSENKDAVGKYRKLKAMAIDAHDHEMDGQFFAYEMMAKRGTETKDFFPLLFNSLYGILGGYGQSFMRPIAGLLSSWLGFSVLYFILAGSALQEPFRNLFAFGYSFRHSIPLLNSFFKFAESPTVYGYKSIFQKNFDAIFDASGSISWFTYLAILQQFIGLVLLFLLLLALRNTFRLK